MKDVPHIQFAGLKESLQFLFSRLTPQQKRIYAILFLAMVGLAVFENLSVALLAMYTTMISGNQSSSSFNWPHLFASLKESAPFLASYSEITVFSYLVFFSILIKNVATSIFTYIKYKFSSALESELGTKLFSGILAKPYKWHIQKKTADLALAVQWRMFFNTMFVNAFLNIAGEVMVAMMIFSYLAYRHFMISLITFCILGSFSFLSMRVIKSGMRNITTRRHCLHVHINSFVSQAVSAIKDVKLYRKESYFTSYFERDLKTDVHLNALVSLYNRLPSSILETIGFGSLIFVILFISKKTNNDSAEVTAIVSLLAISAWRTLPALYRILDAYAVLSNGSPYLKSELELLYEVEQAGQDIEFDDQRATFVFQNEIVADHIGFKHEAAGKLTLHDISLRIPKGITLGLIGVSGSGKTTFVDILTGLLTPSTGSLKVDNRIMEEADQPSWRRNIGYVSQSPFILDGTVSENVAFGLPEDQIDHERVKTCCAMAAIDFLESLPEGMNTILGERGVRLSGGQRQRIAIARALYNDPPILVFDEATSALDRATEHSILETIYNLRQGQTIVIVAHRLSTVERCDRLVWIEDGQIALQGPPGDVLERYMDSMRQRCA